MPNGCGSAAPIAAAHRRMRIQRSTWMRWFSRMNSSTLVGISSRPPRMVRSWTKPPLAAKPQHHALPELPTLVLERPGDRRVAPLAVFARDTPHRRTETHHPRVRRPDLGSARSYGADGSSGKHAAASTAAPRRIALRACRLCAGLTAFFQRFLQDLLPDNLVGHDFLEQGVFSLQLVAPLGLADLDPPNPTLPTREGLLANA